MPQGVTSCLDFRLLILYYGMLPCFLSLLIFFNFYFLLIWDLGLFMYAYLRFAGGEISNMVKNEDSGSPHWSASLFMQTTEDVARAVAAAAAAATTVRSPRPYVVFSSKDDNGNSPLHILQHQVSRVLKGFSQPPEVKSGTYNPEVLTSQKRQWASVQLQSLVFIFISSKTLFGPGYLSL